LCSRCRQKAQHQGKTHLTEIISIANIEKQIFVISNYQELTCEKIKILKTDIFIVRALTEKEIRLLLGNICIFALTHLIKLLELI
jgi:hypothetical protein